MPVTEFIVAGGLIKNAFLMQIYADVIGRPISIAESAQGPALGSAIHAAVAAGLLPRRGDRGRRHGPGDADRLPSRSGDGTSIRRAVRRVPAACTTTSAGRPERGGNDVLHRLRASQNEVTGA